MILGRVDFAPAAGAASCANKKPIPKVIKAVAAHVIFLIMKLLSRFQKFFSSQSDLKLRKSMKQQIRPPKKLPMVRL
jgi:hypothetical protein